MSRNQRLGYLGVAVAIAVVAIVVFAASGGPDETAEDAASPAAQQTATATATETADAEQTATPEPTPTPRPKPPLLTAGKVTELRFEEGDTIRFRVRHDSPEHVHVHGYDELVDLVPGETATVSFKATITGIFEIELEDSAEPIGELRVDPR
jgi:FtsP/CotA-like multicopper oxidase with cupredoxin domain